MPAIRDNAHKPPIGYVLTFPEALTELANVCRHGEAKYSQWNYLASNKPLVGEYVNCLTRHLTKWVNGKDVDDESGLNHLAFVLWNALALCQFALDKTGIDDRPKRDKPLVSDKEVFDPNKHYFFGPEGVYVSEGKENPLIPSQEEQRAKNREHEERHKYCSPKPCDDNRTHWKTVVAPPVIINDNFLLKVENPQPFERLVPRYVEEPGLEPEPDLEPDMSDVQVFPDPDPLSPAGSVLVRLYDLGTFQMIESDFRNRDSSLVWGTRDSARKAVFGLVERGWARRVSDLP